jgi:LysR family transcriptional regulator for bpeEF and oprC
MTMDRLSAMSTFLRVAEAGSFTRAAETLALPKAKVTRLVQRLEVELGVRLLHRTTRQLALTAEGANYYESALALLADLDDLEAQARKSDARTGGVLRVETDASMGALVLMPALPAFQALYPDIVMELSSGNRTVDLVSENIDCALRTGQGSSSAFARRVGICTFVTCASPAYLAAMGRPARPEDLVTLHHTVGLTASNGTALDFRFDSPQGPSVALTLRHRVLVDDPIAYVDAARADLGIIQTPDHAVRTALAAGELEAVLTRFSPPSAVVDLIANPTRAGTARLRIFSDWLARLLESTPTQSTGSTPPIDGGEVAATLAR